MAKQPLLDWDKALPKAKETPTYDPAKQVQGYQRRIEGAGLDAEAASDDRNALEKVLNLKPNQNTFWDIMEIINRPQQALFSGIKEGQAGRSFGKGLWKGFIGETDIRGKELLTQGEGAQVFLDRPGKIDFVDIAGFALDVFADPIDIPLLPITGAAGIAVNLLDAANDISKIADSAQAIQKGFDALTAAKKGLRVKFDTVEQFADVLAATKMSPADYVKQVGSSVRKFQTPLEGTFRGIGKGIDLTKTGFDNMLNKAFEAYDSALLVDPKYADLAKDIFDATYSFKGKYKNFKEGMSRFVEKLSPFSKKFDFKTKKAQGEAVLSEMELMWNYTKFNNVDIVDYTRKAIDNPNSPYFKLGYDEALEQINKDIINYFEIKGRFVPTISLDEYLKEGRSKWQDVLSTQASDYFEGTIKFALPNKYDDNFFRQLFRRQRLPNGEIGVFVDADLMDEVAVEIKKVTTALPSEISLKKAADKKFAAQQVREAKKQEVIKIKQLKEADIEAVRPLKQEFRRKEKIRMQIVKEANYTPDQAAAAVKRERRKAKGVINVLATENVEAVAKDRQLMDLTDELSNLKTRIDDLDTQINIKASQEKQYISELLREMHLESPGGFDVMISDAQQALESGKLKLKGQYASMEDYLAKVDKKDVRQVADATKENVITEVNRVDGVTVMEGKIIDATSGYQVGIDKITEQSFETMNDLMDAVVARGYKNYGAWKSSKTGRWVLDPSSRYVNDLDDALNIGATSKQVTIWDWNKKEEWSVSTRKVIKMPKTPGSMGGSGAAPASTPPTTPAAPATPAATPAASASPTPKGKTVAFGNAVVDEDIIKNTLRNSDIDATKQSLRELRNKFKKANPNAVIPSVNELDAFVDEVAKTMDPSEIRKLPFYADNTPSDVQLPAGASETLKVDYAKEIRNIKQQIINRATSTSTSNKYKPGFGPKEGSKAFENQVWLESRFQDLVVSEGASGNKELDYFRELIRDTKFTDKQIDEIEKAFDRLQSYQDQAAKAASPLPVAPTPTLEGLPTATPTPVVQPLSATPAVPTAKVPGRVRKYNTDTFKAADDYVTTSRTKVRDTIEGANFKELPETPKSDSMSYQRYEELRDRFEEIFGADDEMNDLLDSLEGYLPEKKHQEIMDMLDEYGSAGDDLIDNRNRMEEIFDQLSDPNLDNATKEALSDELDELSDTVQTQLNDGFYQGDLPTSDNFTLDEDFKVATPEEREAAKRGIDILDNDGNVYKNVNKIDEDTIKDIAVYKDDIVTSDTGAVSYKKKYTIPLTSGEGEIYIQAPQIRNKNAYVVYQDNYQVMLNDSPLFTKIDKYSDEPVTFMTKTQAAKKVREAYKADLAKLEGRPYNAKALQTEDDWFTEAIEQEQAAEKVIEARKVPELPKKAAPTLEGIPSKVEPEVVKTSAPAYNKVEETAQMANKSTKTKKVAIGTGTNNTFDVSISSKSDKAILEDVIDQAQTKGLKLEDYSIYKQGTDEYNSILPEESILDDGTGATVRLTAENRDKKLLEAINYKLVDTKYGKFAIDGDSTVGGLRDVAETTVTEVDVKSLFTIGASKKTTLTKDDIVLKKLEMRQAAYKKGDATIKRVEKEFKEKLPTPENAAYAELVTVNRDDAPTMIKKGSKYDMDAGNYYDKQDMQLGTGYYLETDKPSSGVSFANQDYNPIDLSKYKLLSVKERESEAFYSVAKKLNDKKYNKDLFTKFEKYNPYDYFNLEIEKMNPKELSEIKGKYFLQVDMSAKEVQNLIYNLESLRDDIEVVSKVTGKDINTVKKALNKAVEETIYIDYNNFDSIDLWEFAKKQDSSSTQFIKSLGFDGIDLRALDDRNSIKVSDVIVYDIEKGLVPKNKIYSFDEKINKNITIAVNSKPNQELFVYSDVRADNMLEATPTDGPLGTAQYYYYEPKDFNQRMSAQEYTITLKKPFNAAQPVSPTTMKEMLKTDSIKKLIQNRRIPVNKFVKDNSHLFSISNKKLGWDDINEWKLYINDKIVDAKPYITEALKQLGFDGVITSKGVTKW